MSDRPLQQLQTVFAELTDPLVERTKEHALLDIVAIAICAMICGVDGWVAVEEFGKTKQTFLAQFLALPNGIPSHNTFGRVFAALDAQAFQAGFLRWVRAIWPSTSGELIVLDVRPSVVRTTVAVAKTLSTWSPPGPVMPGSFWHSAQSRANRMRL